MIVGVIGSGSIGPDLAYGFVSALGRDRGSKVYLHDIRQEALDAGLARIHGYIAKGLARGKLSPKAAAAAKEALIATGNLADLADCDYVLEAASENLDVKRAIIGNLEEIVRPDCLIGFATSGIPRARIAADARHPERCFVNHPFFPAWRTLPIEVVLSGDAALGAKMIATMKKLGKVPIITADVPCFAADDVFCNYISEAVRIAEDGVANPAQIDAIVNDAIGGGGPFNVMDLTRGNLLVKHCQELMQEADTGSDWFAPPAGLAAKGNDPWHDRRNPLDPTYTEEQKRVVLDRMLAVLFARTYFVADYDICELGPWNWLTRMSLGFRAGLLDLADELGVDRVHDLCTRYAADHPGFEVPPSIANKALPSFTRNVMLERDGDVATVTIVRPEVMNALSKQTVEELGSALAECASDPDIKGVVVTSYGGSLAGADIGELAALPTPEACEALCNWAHGVFATIAQMDEPVVCAVNGPVLGGGAELAMCCDARVVGPALMLGQPEVNLGIIPGYGGTQRLPRLIGLERALDLLRTGRSVGAADACAWGWATGEPVADAVGAAKALVRSHLAGDVELKPVDPAPIEVPAELPAADIGHRSLATDAILIGVVRDGLAKPLAEGLAVEAAGFAACKRTVDMNIGLTNFVVNGPRVPAAFLHE